jgi:hypothetical protein
LPRDRADISPPLGVFEKGGAHTAQFARAPN